MGTGYQAWSAQLRPGWDIERLLIVLLLAALAAACLTGTRLGRAAANDSRSTTSRTVDPGFEALGHWASWRAPLAHGTPVPPDPPIAQLAPDGTPAILDTSGRLTIWTVSEDMRLSEQLWDSAAGGGTVMDFVWAGREVVFGPVMAMNRALVMSRGTCSPGLTLPTDSPSRVMVACFGTSKTGSVSAAWPTFDPAADRSSSAPTRSHMPAPFMVRLPHALCSGRNGSKCPPFTRPRQPAPARCVRWPERRDRGTRGPRC